MSRSAQQPPVLSFFGGPELSLPDGTLVRLTPTQEALLALVWGSEAQGVTRRRVIALLWEEEDTSRARHRLSQLLHEVRARIGVLPFELQGDDLMLPGYDVVECDVAEYRTALDEGALQKALVIEKRGFATRLKRIPGEAYEDWLLARRTGLRRELRETAARAWDQRRPREGWKAAREAAEVLHLLDPGNAAALRRVIESRAMTGGFEAAEAAFAAHVEEVGGLDHVEPDTLELMERVRRLAGDRGTAGPRDRALALPLVGRTEDLEVARAALDRVRRGGFELVLMHGEGGVGKSRLLEEIRKEAHIRGFRCLEAHPVELEYHIPLNPLIDALEHPEIAPYLRGLEDPWRAVIAALLPRLPPGMERGEVPPIAESSLSRRLCDAFWTLFTSVAEDAPTLLFIDDLQWADATTIAVLQFMHRRWREGSLGVICTLRPDLIQEGSGVEKYLTGDDAMPVTTIPVGDLAQPEARELVERVAEEVIDESVVDRLCALGGRNPFYLIELTRDYLADQLQLPELDKDAVVIPISVQQLIAPRFKALSGSAEELLSLLAVWGRWASVTDLAALGRTNTEDVLRRVEELEGHRLLSIDADQVRIAHELFRGVVYHRLGAVRRAMLHRAVAEFLLTQEEPQAGELAVHFGHAGKRDKAAYYGRQAADAALESGAMAEAAHFLRVVVENEKDEVLRAEATGDWGRVLHMKRDMAAAIPVLEAAIERLGAVGRWERSLRMEIRRVECLAECASQSLPHLLRGLADIKDRAVRQGDDEARALVLDAELHLVNRAEDIDGVRRVLAEARACIASPDPRARCVSNATLAVGVLFQSGGEALASARAAVDLVVTHGLSEYRVLALTRLSMVLVRLGQFESEEATSVFNAALKAAKKSGDLAFQAHLLLNEGVAAMDGHRLDLAAERFTALTSLVRHASDTVGRYKLSCNLGEVAFMQGDYEAMLSHYLDAEAFLGEMNVPVDARRVVASGIGLASLELGHLREARARDHETSDFPDDWHFDPYVFLCFRARLLERRGDIEAAVDLLSSYARYFEDWMPVLSIKLLMRAATASARTRSDAWRDIAQDGIRISEDCGLMQWRRQFDTLVQAVG